MRVVTLDGTRLSLRAALRCRPPGRPPRKMTRSASSMACYSAAKNNRFTIIHYRTYCAVAMRSMRERHLVAARHRRSRPGSRRWRRAWASAASPSRRSCRMHQRTSRSPRAARLRRPITPDISSGAVACAFVAHASWRARAMGLAAVARRTLAWASRRVRGVAPVAVRRGRGQRVRADRHRGVGAARLAEAEACAAVGWRLRRRRRGHRVRRRARPARASP